MKNADTTKKMPAKHDWDRFDAMTEAQRHAAALSDPDAQPVTPDNVKRMKPTPQVKVIRRHLDLAKKSLQGGSTFRSAHCAIGSKAVKSLMRQHAPTLSLSPAIPMP
jgi:hypothetical protein